MSTQHKIKMVRTKLIKAPRGMKGRNYLIACTPVPVAWVINKRNWNCYQHTFDLAGTLMGKFTWLEC